LNAHRGETGETEGERALRLLRLFRRRRLGRVDLRARVESTPSVDALDVPHTHNYVYVYVHTHASHTSVNHPPHHSPSRIIVASIPLPRRPLSRRRVRGIDTPRSVRGTRTRRETTRETRRSRGDDERDERDETTVEVEVVVIVVVAIVVVETRRPAGRAHSSHSLHAESIPPSSSHRDDDGLATTRRRREMERWTHLNNLRARHGEHPVVKLVVTIDRSFGGDRATRSAIERVGRTRV